MTFREKLKEEHPDMHENFIKGSFVGCPSRYKYEAVQTMEDDQCLHPDLNCWDCWDREMPEPEISNICDGRKIMEDENELDNVSIWPEVVLLLAFLGLFFIIAVSQMV